MGRGRLAWRGRMWWHGLWRFCGRDTHGVPTTNYVPLLALLRRRLSDEEVVAVASELTRTASCPLMPSTFVRQSSDMTANALPPDEVERVQQRLRSGESPIDDVGPTGLGLAPRR